MRVLNSDVIDEIGTTVSSVERDRDEDLLGVVADGFYQIGPYVVSGHDLNSMRRVTWDAGAQEWKVMR